MALQQHTLSTLPLQAGGHYSPFQRLLALIQEDKKDLYILLIYTLLAGLLTLTIPLAAQAVVNTIAAGVFLQPLAVLTLLLFVGLVFAGVLKISQFYITEILQQRVFARVALNLAERVPFIQHQVLIRNYPPELLNRFFDIIKVQKTMAKLLLEGPTALLQIMAGLILIAIYNPVLLGFDLLILLFMGFVAFILGKDAIHTSVEESAQKYQLAGWLEELARCQVSFKVDGSPHYLVNRTDAKVVDYIHARQAHFRILFKQMFANYFFQATASAGILGIGGWLVIQRQLTLGQLVASELVILILLSAMDKLVLLFQDWYDLLTAVEKIGHVTDLPLERKDGKLVQNDAQGAKVLCRNVSFAYNHEKLVLNHLSLSIEPGEFVSLVGISGVGKSTLAALLCGLMEPHNGLVEINGIDLRQTHLQSLRETVALVNDNNEIFDGTLEENITVGRSSIAPQQIRWALSVTQLTDEIFAMPEGLQTPLVSTGRNLSRGQIQRLMIARAIVDKPKLLILDEAFTGIDERTKLQIIEALLTPETPWTIIDISHDIQIIMRSHRVLVLEQGEIVEEGSPQELASRYDSVFTHLFPLDARSPK